jgi:hypothetical protein
MAKIDSATLTRNATAMLAAVLAGLLSGCGGSGADMASRFVVTPNKYQYYNCEQIADQVKISAAREKELEQLMAKAGPVMSAVTYEPDYVAARGELRELRRTSIEKQCDKNDGKTAGAAASDTIKR